MFTNHTRNYTKFVKEIVINKFLRKTAVAAWTLDVRTAVVSKKPSAQDTLVFAMNISQGEVKYYA